MPSPPEKELQEQVFQIIWDDDGACVPYQRTAAKVVEVCRKHYEAEIERLSKGIIFEIEALEDAVEGAPPSKDDPAAALARDMIAELRDLLPRAALKEPSE